MNQLFDGEIYFLPAPPGQWGQLLQILNQLPFDKRRFVHVHGDVLGHLELVVRRHLLYSGLSSKPQSARDLTTT